MTKPDIILITETWLNDDINNASMNIPGYTVEIRKDRHDTNQGIGGGIIVYTKLGVKTLPEKETEIFNQYCRFTVKTKNEELTITVIYRPPSSGKGESRRTVQDFE